MAVLSFSSVCRLHACMECQNETVTYVVHIYHSNLIGGPVMLQYCPNSNKALK